MSNWKFDRERNCVEKDGKRIELSERVDWEHNQDVPESWFRIKDCEACNGQGVGVDVQLISGCCGNANRDGSCCGNAIPVPQQVQVQCEYCLATGKVAIPLSQPPKDESDEQGEDEKLRQFVADKFETINVDCPVCGNRKNIPSDEWLLNKGLERFAKPSPMDLVAISILFTDEGFDKQKSADMVAMCQLVIDRLYENGTVKNPSSKEAE